MSTVRQRCVFYVSGFDPKGASHYHALYTEQAALQAEAGGLRVDVSPRRKTRSGNASWTLHASSDELVGTQGEPVETHYELLRWDDIVRAHWPRHFIQLWKDIVVTSLFNLRNGAWRKMLALSWPPAVALGLPLAWLVAVVVGVPMVTAGIGWSANRLGASTWLACASMVASASALLYVAFRMESHFAMHWLMRSYAFTRRQALGQVPQLETRLDEHARRLAERLEQGGDDEVLVVGHSSGAILVCSIVARALRLLPEATRLEAEARLSLLTLGHCIPMLGLIPQASQFRRELSVLAAAEKLTWIDFSAPPDGCCFALSDPIAGCGVEQPEHRQNRPKLLSPRFAEMFDAQKYQQLKRDKFRIHFQYLMAADQLVAYDYFQITAGPQSLRARYAKHPSVVGYER